jgi:hypothetical protein
VPAKLESYYQSEIIMRRLLALIFVLSASAAHAQTPNTTKPSLINMLTANCTAAQMVVGSATTPACGPAAATAGDVVYFNGTNFVVLAGNNSGTKFLQETASGVPSWATVSGSVTAGSLPGITTAGSATAGSVGEYNQVLVPLGSAVSIPTSGNTVTVASTSLAAGEYDVSGVVYTANGGTTTFTFMEVGINGTAATLPTRAATGSNGVQAGSNNFENYSGSAGLNQTLVTGTTRVILSGAQTIYLVASATFGTSTCAVYGVLRWRRTD